MSSKINNEDIFYFLYFQPNKQFCLKKAKRIRRGFIKVKRKRINETFKRMNE